MQERDECKRGKGRKERPLTRKQLHGWDKGRGSAHRKILMDGKQEQMFIPCHWPAKKQRPFPSWQYYQSPREQCWAGNDADFPWCLKHIGHDIQLQTLFGDLPAQSGLDLWRSRTQRPLSIYIGMSLFMWLSRWSYSRKHEKRLLAAFLDSKLKEYRYEGFIQSKGNLGLINRLKEAETVGLYAINSYRFTLRYIDWNPIFKSYGTVQNVRITTYGGEWETIDFFGYVLILHLRTDIIRTMKFIIVADRGGSS